MVVKIKDYAGIYFRGAGNDYASVKITWISILHITLMSWNKCKVSAHCFIDDWPQLISFCKLHVAKGNLLENKNYTPWKL